MHWDRDWDWDWELFWQQVFDWAFQYRYYVAFVAVALTAVTLVSSVAPVAAAEVAAAAPIAFIPTSTTFAATAPAAAKTVAGVTAAAPWLTGVLSLVWPVGVTAATFYTANQAWENRYVIMGATLICGFVALLLPVVLKALFNRCCHMCASWFCSSPRDRKKSPRVPVRKFTSRRLSTKQTLRRRGSETIAEVASPCRG